MSRRSRNSRAWRYVWGGIRRDADARALVLASESEEWNYERLEVNTQVIWIYMKCQWRLCVSYDDIRDRDVSTCLKRWQNSSQ